jgi:hypothetical protein
MLDETWETKLENAKHIYRNNPNLDSKAKNDWEIRYEAIQSQLRKLAGLRGNPQAYQQMQQQVTAQAINLGVIKP